MPGGESCVKQITPVIHNMLADPHRKRAFFFHGLDRVHAEVEQKLMHLGGISHNGQMIRILPVAEPGDFQALFNRCRNGGVKRFHGTGHDPAEVMRLLLVFFLAAEGKDLADQFLGPGGSLVNLIQAMP